MSKDYDAGDTETKCAYLRNKIEEYNKMYEELHTQCENVSVNMTSEYKAVRESLMVQITGLEHTITELKNQLRIN